MTDCSKILEEDLRWREAELASLKRLAIVNQENEVIHRSILRACFALLYAHFEGFTKFCWELLLDHVQNKGIAIEDLKDEYLVLALEKDFRKLRGDNSALSIWKFYSLELPNILKKMAYFHQDCRPDTDSNLWPNIFERECAKLGIKSSELQNNKPRIKALVSRRNDIAHGKSMTIKSVDEYSKFERATFLVLHDIAIQVLDILDNEAYKSSYRSTQYFLIYRNSEYQIAKANDCQYRLTLSNNAGRNIQSSSDKDRFIIEFGRINQSSTLSK